MSASPQIRVIVSIDTEEDNWGTNPGPVTTTNIGELPKLERHFEALGVRATYFTNYAVVAEPASAAVIRDIHASGRAEIGAHLHPWNTPPLGDVGESMMLNLPLDVQRAKIETVTLALEDVLGARPAAFRAGRFGLGASTVRALIDAGYAIDSSVTPLLSWEKYDRGPSYIGAPLHMYRLSGAGDVRLPDDGPLVEVPLSCGYTRWSSRRWPAIRSFLAAPLVNRLRLRGLASRTGIARPILLSPEGHDARDLYGLCRLLIDAGLPFVHVFWHSPSMLPGLSPFSRTRSDVERLLRAFDGMLDLLHRSATPRFVTISEAVAETVAAPAERPVAANAAPVDDAVYVATGSASGISAPVEAGVGEAAEEAASVSRVGRHTAIYLGGIILSRVVSFVMLPFYTRYLTPADYGVITLLDMTLDIISIIAGSRIASGIHRFYFKAETDAERNAVLSTAFLIMAVSFAFFGLLTFAIAEPLTILVLGSAEHVDLTRIAGVTFAFQALVVAPFGIVQLWKRSVLYSLLNTGKLLIQLTLNIVLLAFAGYGAKGVFVSTLVANLVIGCIVTAMVLKPIGVHYSKSAAASLIRYGLPLVWTQFATFFVTFGDRYFLRVSADVATVGLYGLAYNFGFIVTGIGYVPFALIWEPTRFQIASSPDRDALYSRAFTFMNILQLLTTVGCALFVRDFIIVMSAEAFHSAYLIVPVILAAYVLQSWALFHEVGILIKERTEYITAANWIAAVVALIGYAVLIPLWLEWGAAITTVLAFFVRWLVTYIFAQRLYPIRYDWTPVWRLVALSGAFIGAGVLLPHPSVAASLAMRAVLFSGYCIALWNIGVISTDEKARLRGVMSAPRKTLAGLMGQR